MAAIEHLSQNLTYPGMNGEQKSPWIEVDQNVITSRRLLEVYRFSSHFLNARHKESGETLQVCDVGIWGGAYDDLILSNPHIGVLHGIDINPAKVKLKGRREIPGVIEPTDMDVVRGAVNDETFQRYVMDGTQTGFSNNSFDFVYLVEVLVGLQGDEEHLLSEASRILKPGGYAIITFQDELLVQGFPNLDFSPARTSSGNKKSAYSKERVSEVISGAFDDKVMVSWYGQFPFTFSEQGTTSPFWPLSGPMRRIREDAFTIEPVYNNQEEPKFIPYYWIGVIKKNSLQ